MFEYGKIWNLIATMHTLIELMFCFEI